MRRMPRRGRVAAKAGHSVAKRRGGGLFLLRTSYPPPPRLRHGRALAALIHERKRTAQPEVRLRPRLHEAAFRTMRRLGASTGSLRPTSAGLAVDEPAQREVRVRTPPRCRARQSPGKYCLRAVEQILRDERVEVASLCSDAVLGHIHDAGVELIAQQHPDRLRRERTAPAVRQAPGSRLLEHLLLKETPGCVLLEHSTHDRRAFRVRHQALAHRPRGVQVAERRQEGPASQLQRGLHAGTCPV